MRLRCSETNRYSSPDAAFTVTAVVLEQFLSRKSPKGRVETSLVGCDHNLALLLQFSRHTRSGLTPQRKVTHKGIPVQETRYLSMQMHSRVRMPGKETAECPSYCLIMIPALDC